VAASAPDRFALHVTIGSGTHEKLRQAQALLSHKVPSGDLGAVLDLALDALVEKLEKRKFAKTDKPRSLRRHSNADPRHVSAHVKRAVWQRDGGRCTFVGDTGRRCNAHKFLEYDHVQPVARGGQATVSGVRLRCRAHNQYEAERTFGAGFMAGKRNAVIRSSKAARVSSEHAAGARADAVPSDATTPEASDVATDHAQDVIACLRTLGVSAEQARRVTRLSAAAPAATLEARVRAALQYLGPRPRRLI
jgi:hypothetical protein